MRKQTLIAISAMALAACSAEPSGTFETEDGEGTYTVDSDGNGVNISGTDGSGEQFSVNSGDNAAVDMPDGFSVFPGANVVSNTSMSSGEGKAVIISMESDAKPDALISHYRQQAEAAGMTIQGEIKAGGNTTIMGDGGTGSGFQLTVEPAGTGSKATLMAGVGME